MTLGFKCSVCSNRIGFKSLFKQDIRLLTSPQCTKCRNYNRIMNKTDLVIFLLFLFLFIIFSIICGSLAQIFFNNYIIVVTMIILYYLYKSLGSLVSLYLCTKRIRKTQLFSWKSLTIQLTRCVTVPIVSLLIARVFVLCALVIAVVSFCPMTRIFIITLLIVSSSCAKPQSNLHVRKQFIGNEKFSEIKLLFLNNNELEWNFFNQKAPLRRAISSKYIIRNKTLKIHLKSHTYICTNFSPSANTITLSGHPWQYSKSKPITMHYSESLAHD